ncbi:amidase [Polynucleobacter rarus]|jgi:amidase|uniref:amidase n=1 Tax=Polynucleobacter rarus TaxID=556055 RepID=UPI000D3E6C50|nr:amidase [Polynucleobacter rarus]
MKEMPKDIYSAFILQGEPLLAGNSTGKLKNLSFGLKDVLDVAGYPTSFGSPDWLKTHEVPTETAPIVTQLLSAGANLVGKTHTDELTYSILGMNAHFGTPLNPLTPERVPGGSSSGSAVAVAGNLVDFAIGTDTGGSVRLPASFCGIYGIRPTHGTISLEHARPLAKSFDTLGWFARDAKTLLDVGEVLINRQMDDKIKPDEYKIIIPKPALHVLSSELQQIFLKNISEIFKDFDIQQHDFEWMQLRNFAETFRVIQAREIWLEYGSWASQYLDNFGPGIKQRILIAKEISEESSNNARDVRKSIQLQLNEVLTSNTLFLVPTASNLAPMLTSSQEDLEQFRKDTFQLVSIAGLGGLPQVNIPAFKINGCGFGISLIGAHHTDLQLLEFINKNLQF